MNDAPPARPHLIERAVEALNQSRGSTMPTAEPTSATPSPPGPAAGRTPLAEQAIGTADARDLLRTDGPAPSPGPAAPPILRARLEAAGLALGQHGRSRLSEEVAVAQHQILRAARPEDGGALRAPIILVTSARPAEGKSFSALNIAAGMAVFGAQKVVLVDTDGKKNSLSEQLGCGDTAGLRALATSTGQRVEGFLVRTAIDNLSLLPFGPSSGAASAGGARVVAAIERLAAALPGHVIVLDTAPCLSTSDPSTMAAIADFVVMVVQAERTQRNEVEAALDLVDACPRIHLLLNKVELAVSDAFGAYGGYGAYGG